MYAVKSTTYFWHSGLVSVSIFQISFLNKRNASIALKNSKNVIER